MKRQIVTLVIKIVAVFFCQSTTTVHAQTIYKKLNKDGTVTFSDKPIEGASKIALRGKQTLIPSRASLNSKVSPLKSPAAVLPELKILRPKHEETIRNNAGNITISAITVPDLPGTFLLRLRDKTLESSDGQFTLTGLDRGTYPYQINFIDNKGKVIASSPTQRFYLHKNSIIAKPLVQSKPQ